MIMDDLEKYQLKECYELAARYEKTDLARDILRNKAKQINISDSFIPVRADSSYGESDMEVLSEAVYRLTIDGDNNSDSSTLSCFSKVNSLPETAEKEYVLALLALREGTNETQRLEAMRHLQAAHGYSPNDPRYNALINVLIEASR